jgi:3-deoxy-D-manno-octulosonic-acid transferase
MSLFLYNLLLTLCALPALPFAGAALALRPQYRLGLAQRLWFLPSTVTQRVAGRTPFWVHAPSVGEILATRPFLRALKQTFPQTPLLLSCLTPTAYATACAQLSEADAVMYFPLDHPVCVEKVLGQIRPSMFFFTETELWPNFLSTLARHHIPAVMVSGRFSPRASRRYRWLYFLFRPILRSLTLCCMQTAADADRLIAAGAPANRVVVTGNFKVDNVGAQHVQGSTVLKEAGLASRLLFVGASTHPGEEEILLQVFRQLQSQVPSLLLLLAPRHPQRFAQVESLLSKGGYRYIKRSQMAEIRMQNPEVFLLDSLGELASFYPVAALAFVGGSLVKGPGGHSVIEPALAQIPVCFGPYTHNFSSIVEELLHEGGSFVVRDVDSFCQYALPLLRDERARSEMGRHAAEVVHRGQGAVARTLTIIREGLLHSPLPKQEQA